MYKKYENKTYTESAQNDVSDLEIKKNNFVLKNKTNNNTDTEQNNKKQITFQPKCIFTKQNNNISFYQSNSKNSRRTSTNNKDLSPLPDGKKPITQKINSLSQSQNFGEEKFSYNYTSLKRENSNKINKKVSKENNQRINIDEINTKYQKPQRTIKSYKKQFNVEKSDNFNMLSYRPMEYDSDINLNLNKERPKIIPIYKKQEVDEIFYPSKRTHSPQAPADNEEIKDKYQTHTLKYQSFFGSFNGSKNSRVAKSNSKINANQLNDFNIDKLIEIGDKYVKFGKPVLPLGKILNNNIINYNNRIKTKKKIPINSKQFNTYYSYEVQPIPNFSKYSKKSGNKIIDKNNEDLNNNITKDKNRVSKKIISKNILKNTKLDNSNQIINTELSQKRNSRKNTKKVHKNNLEKKEENQNIEEKEENEKIKKKRANLNSSQKHIGISDNNKSEKNYIITNIRNEEQNTQNNLTEQKLLTDDEGKNRTKIKSNEKKIVSNKNILVTECKKYNKNNRVASNLYYKDNKQKNYYGFDERHNLEDTIDNHAYYESIHSKKKISNLCIDKVI
jgi:hypothetical protein